MSVAVPNPPLARKLSSPSPFEIAFASKKSFEYITDDTDDSVDTTSDFVFYKGMSKSDRQHLLRIQDSIEQVSKDNSFTQLTSPKFLQLLEQIAPHVSAADAIALFQRFDVNNAGQVDGHALLHNQLLPEVILRLEQRALSSDDTLTSPLTLKTPAKPKYNNTITSIDENILDETDENDYKHLTWQQLFNENTRLRNWIRNEGQPAVEKALELSAIVTIYQSDHDQTQHRLSQVKIDKESLDCAQEELSLAQDTSRLLMQDNQELMMQAEMSDNRFKRQTHQLSQATSQLDEYKRIANDLQRLNKEYMNRNAQLQEDKDKLQRELQILRAEVLRLQQDGTLLQNEHQKELAEVFGVVDELREELRNKNVITCDESMQEFDDAPVEMHMRRLQTLGQRKQSVMDVAPLQRYKTLTNWYSMDVMSRHSSVADEEEMPFKMWTQKSVDVFDAAVTQEYKSEWETQVKDNLEQEYDRQLKQQRLDSEMKMKEMEEENKREVEGYKKKIKMYKMELEKAKGQLETVDEEDGKDVSSDSVEKPTVVKKEESTIWTTFVKWKEFMNGVNSKKTSIMWSLHK